MRHLSNTKGCHRKILINVLKDWVEFKVYFACILLGILTKYKPLFQFMILHYILTEFVVI